MIKAGRVKMGETPSDLTCETCDGQSIYCVLQYTNDKQVPPIRVLE